VPKSKVWQYVLALSVPLLPCVLAMLLSGNRPFSELSPRERVLGDFLAKTAGLAFAFWALGVLTEVCAFFMRRGGNSEPLKALAFNSGGPSSASQGPANAADAEMASASPPVNLSPGPQTGDKRTILNLGTEPCLMTDERLATLPMAAPASMTVDQHFIIHAGQELGPFSLAELVGKAVLGEIQAKDLVKSNGGLWTKANEFDILKHQFTQEKSNDELSQAPDKPSGQGGAEGFWASDRNLTAKTGILIIGGGIVLMLLAILLGALWSRPRQPIDSGMVGHDAFNRGVAALENKDYDNAIKNFDEAIKLDGNYGPAFGYRGTVWLKKADYDKAIKDFGEAIRLNPADTSAFWQRGYTWLQKKDYDKAIKDYDDSIRLNATDGGAFINRGYAWSMKMEYDKAIKDFDEAIRLDPKNEMAVSHRTYAVSRKMALNQTFGANDETIQSNPKNADAMLSRGLDWMAKKDFDKAINDFDVAILLSPSDAHFYFCRGLAWKEKKEYGKAIKDYDEAIRIEPNNADFYRSRGDAWWEMNEFDKGRTDYAEGRRLLPKRP